MKFNLVWIVVLAAVSLLLTGCPGEPTAEKSGGTEETAQSPAAKPQDEGTAKATGEGSAASETGEAVGGTLRSVGEATVAGAETVGEKTVEGAKFVGEKTVEGVKKIGEVTKDAAKGVGEGLAGDKKKEDEKGEKKKKK
jgi:hypothetical protein